MITVLVALIAAMTVQTGAPMRTLDRGDQSNIDAPKQVIARTTAEYSQLWRQHAPDRPLPHVDFSTEMVVGLFVGSRNTAGYSVEIVSTETNASGMVVRYRVHEPASDAITAQIITTPYHIVAVPKRAGEATFERVQ